MSGDRPHRPLGSQTAFQTAHVNFVTAIYDARRELNAREWRELLEVLAVLVAKLHREQIDREERPQ